MEEFSFVTLVAGLNRPNTGKEDNDEDESPSSLASDMCNPDIPERKDYIVALLFELIGDHF
jgi:hypothetical protein